LSAVAARPSSRLVLGMRVDATSYGDATERVVSWARSGRSAYVCVAAVNNAILAHDDATFRDVMNGADLITPDGRPLVWALRALGIQSATQVRGTDLMDAVLRRAAEARLPVGFLGSTDAVLAALERRIPERWPGLEVPFRSSPPFRPATPEEDADTMAALQGSGARILFVGLGCPKQESWMARHRSFDGVMIGVGAAFDFLSGEKAEAPRLLQRSGLEWIFRLASEPRRLWKRYLTQNPRFVALLASQLVRSRSRSGPTRGSEMT
jgi:N-acetylglucosaminyldiphosphoundecaprenol N-acetyl-beta-D-mannosaminyltransferase